jgi:hypothetical protein
LRPNAEGLQELAQDGRVALGGVGHGPAWLIEPALDQLDKGVYVEQLFGHERVLRHYVALS